MLPPFPFMYRLALECFRWPSKQASRGRRWPATSRFSRWRIKLRSIMRLRGEKCRFDMLAAL